MIPSSGLLAGIPPGLRDELLEEYRGLTSAFLQGKWKSASLDAGRFCEVTYSILEGALTGNYPAKASKPSDFPKACKALEQLKPVAVGDRSLRILLPRTLPPMYEVRNNRNVGHVGGEVVSNEMDSTYVVAGCTFVLAELVRVFHQCSTADAQTSVDALVERRTPLIWDYGGGKRVLAPSMPAADKVLVLLHSEPDWVTVSDLVAWTKYTNPSQFRSSVLSRLDKPSLIEFDTAKDRCKITPLGIKEVESSLIQ